MNFRQSLVGGVGYCALDKKREPLSGAEQRTCWTGAQTAADRPVTGDGSMAGLLEVLEGSSIETRLPRGGLRPISGQ